jgi:hypothetical protein
MEESVATFVAPLFTEAISRACFRATTSVPSPHSLLDTVSLPL